MKKLPKVLVIGGGVGSSTFTKALKDLPVELTTIVSAFDDGGSTGSIRKHYGGFALGDFRQSILSSLDLPDTFTNTLNNRFGRGNLEGINMGNVLIKSFLSQFSNESNGVKELHKMLGLKNKVIPISYDFSKLCASLERGKILMDQKEIAEYFSFSKARIKGLYLSPKASLNPEAKRAILSANYIFFAPGHFFTSLLPHIFVEDFDKVWKRSTAKKIWFSNLLAHRGQDSFYTLTDYINWFQRRLGKKPFDVVVINKKIPKSIIAQVEDRFEPLRITNADLDRLKRMDVEVISADIVSPDIRKQSINDSVMRAPLRHDYKKIRNFVEKNYL